MNIILVNLGYFQTITKDYFGRYDVHVSQTVISIDSQSWIFSLAV